MVLSKIGFLDVKNHKGETILLYAIDQEDDELAEEMIEAGADINATNNNLETPLYTAVNTNNYNMVKILLEKGALINLAVRHGHLEGVKYNVLHCANINKESDGGTPLYQAISNGYPDIIDFLLSSGADIIRSKIDNVKEVRKMAKECNIPYFIEMFNHGIAPFKAQVLPLLSSAGKVNLRAWEDFVRSDMRGLFALYHGGHDLVDPGSNQ